MYHQRAVVICHHSGATFCDSVSSVTGRRRKKKTWMKLHYTVSVTVAIYRCEILGAVLPPVRKCLRLIKFSFWRPECSFGLSIASPCKGVSVWVTMVDPADSWTCCNWAWWHFSFYGTSQHTPSIEFRLTWNMLAPLYQYQILLFLSAISS